MLAGGRAPHWMRQMQHRQLLAVLCCPCLICTWKAPCGPGRPQATQGPSRSNAALVYAVELIATTTTWHQCHALTPVAMLATAALCTS